MCCGSYILFVCAILSSYGSCIQLDIGSTCKTPNGETAICTSINDCELLFNAALLVKGKKQDPGQKKFLLESLCGWKNDEVALVCCGDSNNYKSCASQNHMNTKINIKNGDLFDEENCGYQDINKIYGGNKVLVNEFPWMALLMYRTKTGELNYLCAGSLINKRYVLTAAHCITEYLILVRLGEYNTNTYIDCEDREHCKPPKNIEIERVIKHENFDVNKRTNDIALIRLREEVDNTYFIHPICLPGQEDVVRVGENLTIAGWGLTEENLYSNVKLSLDVPILNNARCRSDWYYKPIHSQICAGRQDGRDHCSGDSGGPLMKMKDSQWYLEGIISYGWKNCSQTKAPVIYTRVKSYLGWINKNIKY